MITTPAYSARILGAPDVPVSMRSDAGSISLDVADAPHVTAQVTLAMPDAGLLDDLDPRDGRRLVIDAGGRSFDLGIRRARPDRQAGTVAVELASDEALLGDLALLVDDDGPRAHEASLRGVVDYVLGKLGAHLEPGGPDADVTAFWPVTNRLLNGAGKTSVTNWGVGSNCTVGFNGVGLGADGTPGRILMQATAASGFVYACDYAAKNVPASPGERLSYDMSVATTRNADVRLGIDFYDKSGKLIATLYGGAGYTPITPPVTTYVRLGIDVVAPANASAAVPFLSFAAFASGQQMCLSFASLYETRGPVRPGMFSGSSPAGGGYTFAWTGAVDASPCTRTPDVERPPEALQWKAGTSGLEFLRPLLLSAGLRLVCDEQRRWTTRDNTYRAAGAQMFRTGVNLTGGDEELSREDQAWFDGCVIRYQWTDENGIQQERTDTFALSPTPSKVMLREVSAPWPGPGRAEYAVTRAQGVGRTVTGTKQAAWTERAEQEFSAILDGTPIQLGIAEKVVFDIAANTVTTTSRTTDTPAGAINLLQGTINALPGTINNL